MSPAEILREAADAAERCSTMSELQCVLELVGESVAAMRAQIAEDPRAILERARERLQKLGRSGVEVVVVPGGGGSSGRDVRASGPAVGGGGGGGCVFVDKTERHR